LWFEVFFFLVALSGAGTDACISSTADISTALSMHILNRNAAPLNLAFIALGASRSIPERDRWHDRCPFHGLKKGVEANVPCNLNFDSFAFGQQFERWQNVFRI
jgi:hypothetical protein